MNLDAMKALLAAVEGDKETELSLCFRNMPEDEYFAWGCEVSRVFDKHDMNAALALHGALLPGWGWYAGAGVNGDSYAGLRNSIGILSLLEARAPTPARALLIATLRGVIAKMEAADE